MEDYKEFDTFKDKMVEFFSARKSKLIFNLILMTIVFIIGFAIDQLTKYHNFDMNDGVNNQMKVISQNKLWGIRPVINTGMMSSLLAGGHTTLIQIITISIMLICLFSSMWSSTKLSCIALAFIATGAFGNIFDRATTSGQFVRDFIFTPWADHGTFNLADIQVMIGAGLFILNTIIVLVKDWRNK